MVSQKGPRGSFKMLRKSVKADLMCFYKGTKEHPQRASVIFRRLADGLCWTGPLFSPRYSQKCVCALKMTLCKAPTNSVWIFEKYAIKHWPVDGWCGHMTVPWAFQSRRSWAYRSAADVVIIACISCYGVIRRPRSMASFHHHLKLCRQVEELRSSAHVWWMIKLDKWFALLNCPFQRDAH